MTVLSQIKKLLINSWMMLESLRFLYQKSSLQSYWSK